MESEEHSIFVVIDIHFTVASLVFGPEHVLFLFLVQLHGHGM
jgi:hypothetical protein